NNYQDRLHLLVDRVKSRMAGEALAPLPDTDLSAETAESGVRVESSQVDQTQTIEAKNFDADTEVEEAQEQPPVEPTGAGEVAKVLPFAPKPKPEKTFMPGAAPGDSAGARAIAPGGVLAPVQHLAARRTGPQEVVKVSAELLEELVNLAG